MATTKITNAEASNLAGSVTDYSVDGETTDGATGTETTYICENWEQYLGYYKKIPEVKIVIDALATWITGKGVQTKDEYDEIIYKIVNGIGIDTFNTILENQIKTMLICGDSYAEVIRGKDETIVNLKPLDPSSIRIVANKKGVILRYEQVSKLNKTKKIKFDVANIFHLSKNRIADEIHGSGIVEALEEMILMRNEAMNDFKRVLHRNIDPLMIFHLDTDDPTEISAFKAKMDWAKGKNENMYIPKDAVIPEQLTLAPNATLNPLPWIEKLNNHFFQAAGVPQIIVGGAQEITEASAKIAYLAFQQRVEGEQLYIEEQVAKQLGLIIELEFPASLENELLSDNKKDGAINMQRNDTTAGIGQ